MHVVPQSGTYISKISIKQIEEARFVRETLEKEVFVATCQAVTEEQLKELEKLVILQRTYAQLKDEIEFFQLDEALHQLIYKIADKENVWNWLQTINLPLNRFRFLRLEV
ncbi:MULTISPECIES: FCD domain-containing protein [Streptococcus]|uniref:FCD domain-containing protein n=1 Tax=Streptococcus TaxID=1301 RepID=UPI00352A29F6